VDEKDLFQLLKENNNPERAVQMKAYMRNQFEFLGINATKRRELSKSFMKQARQEDKIRWNFLRKCWSEPYREFQYVGGDYLTLKKKELTPTDIPMIKELALTKSWWDTIDVLDKIVGQIALTYPDVNQVLLDWSVSDNIWLRRIAIDHQRLRKQQTNTELLEKIIVHNFGQKEFFINKAIGWALRDYSKTDPEWVRDFVDRYQKSLAPLSMREAIKYL